MFLDIGGKPLDFWDFDTVVAFDHFPDFKHRQIPKIKSVKKRLLTHTDFRR